MKVLISSGIDPEKSKKIVNVLIESLTCLGFKDIEVTRDHNELLNEKYSAVAMITNQDGKSIDTLTLTIGATTISFDLIAATDKFKLGASIGLKLNKHDLSNELAAFDTSIKFLSHGFTDSLEPDDASSDIVIYTGSHLAVYNIKSIKTQHALIKHYDLICRSELALNTGLRDFTVSKDNVEIGTARYFVPNTISLYITVTSDIDVRDEYTVIRMGANRLKFFVFGSSGYGARYTFQPVALTDDRDINCRNTLAALIYAADKIVTDLPENNKAVMLSPVMAKLLTVLTEYTYQLVDEYSRN